MTERLIHPETGIEISNTFRRQMERWRVELAELPGNMADLLDEIEQLNAEIDHVDQQIALEAGGATDVSEHDETWPFRAGNARRMMAGRRGVLRGWQHRMKAAAAQQAERDKDLRHQEAEDLKRGLLKQRNHYQQLSATISVYADALKGLSSELPAAPRERVYSAVADAQAALKEAQKAEAEAQAQA